MGRSHRTPARLYHSQSKVIPRTSANISMRKLTKVRWFESGEAHFVTSYVSFLLVLWRTFKKWRLRPTNKARSTAQKDFLRTRLRPTLSRSETVAFLKSNWSSKNIEVRPNPLSKADKLHRCLKNNLKLCLPKDLITRGYSVLTYLRENILQTTFLLMIAIDKAISQSVLEFDQTVRLKNIKRYNYKS